MTRGVMIACLGCGEVWDNDYDPCGCTCSDPTASDYEDWYIVDDPSVIPDRVHN